MELIRESYLKKIRPFYDNDLVKAVVGIRRSGKSILLSQIKKEIISNGVKEDHIIKIDLEEVSFLFYDIEYIDDFINKLIIDKDKYYIFLDEVQHVVEYELFLARVRIKYNCIVYASASIRSLMNGKNATALVGRMMEFQVLPFSYSETLEYLNVEHSLEVFNEYLTYGGFVGRFSYPNLNNALDYLKVLIEGILYKEVVSGGKRSSDITLEVVKYFCRNYGTSLSFEKIADLINGKKSIKVVSASTIGRIALELESACILSRLEYFDTFKKRTNMLNMKHYITDPAFNVVFSPELKVDRELALENVVYNELINQGYKVYVGKYKDIDIDFVAVKYGKKCFIQVAYLIFDDEVEEREFGIYKHIGDSSPKYVFSLDFFPRNQNGVIHINLIDFLTYKVELFLS